MTLYVCFHLYFISKSFAMRDKKHGRCAIVHRHNLQWWKIQKDYFCTSLIWPCQKTDYLSILQLWLLLIVPWMNCLVWRLVVGIVLMTIPLVVSNSEWEWNKTSDQWSLIPASPLRGGQLGTWTSGAGSFTFQFHTQFNIPGMSNIFTLSYTFLYIFYIFGLNLKL